MKEAIKEAQEDYKKYVDKLNCLTKEICSLLEQKRVLQVQVTAKLSYLTTLKQSAGIKVPANRSINDVAVQTY